MLTTGARQVRRAPFHSGALLCDSSCGDRAVAWPGLWAEPSLCRCAAMGCCTLRRDLDAHLLPVLVLRVRTNSSLRASVTRICVHMALYLRARLYGNDFVIHVVLVSPSTVPHMQNLTNITIQLVCRAVSVHRQSLHRYRRRLHIFSGVTDCCDCN